MITHFLSSEGYFFVVGECTGRPVTAHGFDGIAYHPQKKELIIYENKAWQKASAVTKANPIDPAIGLRKYISETLNLLKGNQVPPQLTQASLNLRTMPHRYDIISKLEGCLSAIDDWIGREMPKKWFTPVEGLKDWEQTSGVHWKQTSGVKVVVSNACGKSTGVGGKLAKSGLIDFNFSFMRSLAESGTIELIDPLLAPEPKVRPIVQLQVDRLATQAEEAGAKAVEAVEERLTRKSAQLANKEAPQAILKARLPKIAAKHLKRLAASKAAKRTASLVPVIGWGFAAKDAYAGVNDIIKCHVWRGLSGIGFSVADVASDFLHLGDAVTGIGGTAISLGIQVGVAAGQIKIELDRAEEKMKQLEEEIERGGLPPEKRLRDYYELDDEAIQQLKGGFR